MEHDADFAVSLSKSICKIDPKCIGIKDTQCHRIHLTNVYIHIYIYIYINITPQFGLFSFLFLFSRLHLWNL